MSSSTIAHVDIQKRRRAGTQGPDGFVHCHNKRVDLSRRARADGACYFERIRFGRIEQTLDKFAQ